MSLKEIKNKEGFFMDVNGKFTWGEFVIWTLAVMALVFYLKAVMI